MAVGSGATPRRHRIEASVDPTSPTPNRRDRLPRIIGIIGIVLYVLTGPIYSASGLVAPISGLVVLFVGWFAGLAYQSRLYRTRPPWTLVMPVVALAYWWLVLTIGSNYLGWTA